MSRCVVCDRPDAWAQDMCPRCEEEQRMAYEEREAQRREDARVLAQDDR